MVFLGIIILSPIFTFLLLKSINNILYSKKIKIIISIVIFLLNYCLGFILYINIGSYYLGTLLIFVMLNILIIVIINLVKLIIKYKNKKYFKIIILIVVIILGMFLIYINIYEKHQNNNIIIINANNMINEFFENNVSADKKYKGNIVEINGIIIYKAFPKDFIPLWDASCIYFGEDIGKGVNIVCYFDNIVVHDLEVGQEITVKCKYIKFDDSRNNIILKKGEIIK